MENTFKYVTVRDIPEEVIKAIEILEANNSNANLAPLQGTKITLNENYSASSKPLLVGELPWSGNYFARWTLNLKGLEFKTSCHVKLLQMIKTYYMK